jgi:hypothetical protein
VLHLTDEAKLDILLREYETLRAEILERLKLAFQQLGWAGALIAFAIPLATFDLSSRLPAVLFWLKVGFAGVGVLVLVWLSVLNWLWAQSCADQLRRIEQEVSEHCGGANLLSWQRRAEQLTRWILLPPRRPNAALSPLPRLATQTASKQREKSEGEAVSHGQQPNNPLQI